MTGPTYEQAAWSWTEHLRSGGRTPWTAWVAAGSGADAPVPPGWSVPGAAQLELLRRAGARGTVPATLADLVLGRSGPGRGLAQQPLAWPGSPARRFGAPPTDPSTVPDEELVRVGVGALTELLLRASDDGRPAAEPRRRRLARGPAFALAGAPVTTSVVRRDLAAAGHVEGGRKPQVLLLAEPLDVALAQVWSARVQRGAPVRWHGFVRRWAARSTLPPSADLPALAAHWADRVGPEQVHVVVAGLAGGTPTAAAVLGVRVHPVPSPRPRWDALTPAGVDLVRRVSSVLNVRASVSAGTAARGRLLADLGGQAPGATDLTVPEASRDWVTRRGRSLAEELVAGGYPVHGDPGRLVPRFEGRPSHPRLSDVLDLVVDVCLSRARLDEQRRRAVQR